MSDQSKPDGVHSKSIPDLIAKLLAERQQMLVLLSRLAELKPYREAKRVQPVLQRFCQVLVDYVALGHFEVYQCLDESSSDSKHCQRIKTMARELFPRIAETTEQAIAFNDRYDTAEHCRILDGLCNDLSHLGEQLANRIDLEDRLIAAIRHPATTPAVSG